MNKQIIADVVALDEGEPLAGWDLLAQDIAIEEAERQRLVQETPELRDQAITALGYWTSLSRRVDSLRRTQNLLLHMRARLPLNTGGVTDSPEARTQD